MDETRLLHQRSELGYTTSTVEAMPSEPEAVSSEWQSHLTAQAARRRSDRRRETWRICSERIRRELDVARPELGKQIASDLRVIERQLAKIDERVAREAA